MNTEFLIIRHGESIGNQKKLFLGHTDLDLTELGYRQAEIAADFLKNEHIDEIYSSDLIRAYNTALPHARLRGMEVKTDKALREIYAGDWEGESVVALREKYPELFTVIWRESFGSFPGASGGGESVSMLALRIEAALISIAEKHPGKRIIIATHAAAIRALWGKISNMSPSEVSSELPFPSNASVTRVSFDGEGLIPKSYSENEHLLGLITTWKD